VPEIRLYTQTVNPYSEKVARALALKKLPFRREISDQPEDVKRWSPVSQRLPVLEIDGDRVHDSERILRWLDERFPEPPLRSSDPKVAASQERLASWSDSSFLWYWDRWRAARYPRPGDEQPANPNLLARVARGIGRSFGGDEVVTRAELREAEIIEELGHRLNDLVGFLGDRPFFYADQPSVADLSVYGMLRILEDGPMTNSASMLHAHKSLTAYLQRMDGLTSSDTADEASDPA
jgi:glutathione S-transferase